LDAFIFDWYWFDDGPFLERGLEEGFLKAANNSRLRFCCMWANHDWKNIHPAKARKSSRSMPGTSGRKAPTSNPIPIMATPTSKQSGLSFGNEQRRAQDYTTIFIRLLAFQKIRGNLRISF
jgi:hypothetical protein